MAYQTMQWYIICYQWFKQGLNPVLAIGHSLKRKLLNPLCLPLEFNLKAYLTQMIGPAWASNRDLSVTVARQRIPRCYQ